MLFSSASLGCCHGAFMRLASSASNGVAARIIARLLITENSVCIQDNFEGQCLLSDTMNHHGTEIGEGV